MLRALGAHLRNQWMGALALFLILGGGTAYAAGTIGSEDIIDESVRSVDLLNNEIRSGDVRDDTQTAGGLRAVDLAPSAVGVSELNPLAFSSLDIAQASATSPFGIPLDAIQGNEVSDGTITGADVDEATFAGLDGHDAFRDLCDTPSDNSYKDCLTITFTLGRSMSVLAIFGGGGKHGGGASDRAYGECKTKVDGVDQLAPVNISNESTVPVGMPTIVYAKTLSAGTHSMTLACREDPTDMHFVDLTIGVVELYHD